MADTVTLEQDIHRIKEDIASIKAEMKHFATKADLEAVKGDLRAEIERMGRTLIMWNVSSIIALTGIVVAVVKLLG
ncbi:MAG: hypothetical protein HZA02_08530 [Nitrospinae bacterium]|nr:hypothetical protein [Nitrospinota bacterium]